MISEDTPLWQLTVGQFRQLIESEPKQEVIPQGNVEYGIAGIARIFNCSLTTANRYKASGKLDKAIKQIGRKIIIDKNKALELINTQK